MDLLSKFSFTMDVLLLVSLALQILLAIMAPWRKNSRKRWAMLILSVVYVELVSFAGYAMGLIRRGRGGTSDLRVFWAPFLILHLGGPNTITGLSLLDNELWLRYLGHLVSLSYTFARVVFHSSSLKINSLWVPTALVFVAGVLKYTERVICLFSARVSKFRDATLPEPNPGENYAKLMQAYNYFKNSTDVPVRLVKCKSPVCSDHDRSENTGKLSQVQIVKDAYGLFHEFQGLFVRSVYDRDQLDKSRRYFLRRNAEDAFSICEVELNLAYDVFYTKAIFIRRTKWPIVNIITFTLQLVSLVIWVSMDKSDFDSSSIHVTDALVYGTISLDLFSLLQFFTSVWNIATVTQESIDSKSIFSSFFCENLLRFNKYMREIHLWRDLWLLQFLFGRWSECIPQLDLVSLCADKKMVEIERKLQGHTFMEKLQYQWFKNKDRTFIFNKLITRSNSAKNPKDAEELWSARGGWILSRLYKAKDLSLDTLFSPWVTDVGYQESLIIWHIATTICYTLDDRLPGDNDLCEHSKLLSDYMMYLLVLRPQIMPPSEEIPGTRIALDTCAEANLFFNWVSPPDTVRNQRVRDACQNIIDVTTDVVSPRQIRGDASNSVLFDACILAKKLRALQEDHPDVNKWEIISNVWAEMLFYCAARSDPGMHVKKLRNGGDLLTLVWLLMAHLGLGNHFRYNKHSPTKARLVVLYPKH